MDFSTLATIITALGGFELVKWAVSFFVNRKNERRKNDSEADKKETEADTDEFHLYKERIEELRQANKELNEQNLELIKTGARKDEIVADKTAKIRELQDGRVEDARKIGLLEKQVAYYKNWFCKREFGNGKGDCKRREPAQNPPLKFSLIEENQTSE